MAELSVFESDRTRDFKVIGILAVQDSRISWQAKGLHLYLISRPRAWKIRTKDLLNRSPGSLYALRRILKELEIFGYLKRSILTDIKTKKIIGNKYFVYEKSQKPSAQIRNTAQKPKTPTSGGIGAKAEVRDSNPITSSINNKKKKPISSFIKNQEKSKFNPKGLAHISRIIAQLPI